MGVGSARRLSGPVHSLLLLLIVLGALVLNLYALDAKSLWYDELGTLTNTGWQGDWLDAYRYPLTIPTLPKPPLCFVVTRLFLALDSSVFMVRLPAAICATLSVLMVYAAGKRLFDRQVGLLAAFLLAIAPLNIRYAQEARMYTMLAFFSLLSLYFFWRAIRSQKMRWWAGFVVAAGLNLYTHQFAFLSLGVMVLFALWLLVRRRVTRSLFPFRAWHLVAAVVIILLLYLPMVPYLIEGVLSEEGLGGSGGVVYGELRWDLASLTAALRLFSGASNLGLVLYAILFLLAVLALIAPWRRGMPELAPERERAYVLALLLMWLILPLALILSIPTGHGVRIRYFLFSLPVYLLLVAYGLRVAAAWISSGLGRLLRRPRVRSLGAAVAGALLLTLLIGATAPAVAAYYGESKQNWCAAVRLVKGAAKPGEPVYVPRRHHRTGVLFYAECGTAGPEPSPIKDVRILPKAPEGDFVPADSDRGWLIVPLQERYLPGGDLEARLQPDYQLSEPVVFDPASIPQDSQLIAPICYRSLAVVEVTRIQPPSISFYADDEVLDQGECTWLHWEVENVREVYVDGEGVVGHDECQVCPLATTVYELEAVCADRTETIEIEIVVRSGS